MESDTISREEIEERISIKTNSLEEIRNEKRNMNGYPINYFFLSICEQFERLNIYLTRNLLETNN